MSKIKYINLYKCSDRSDIDAKCSDIDGLCTIFMLLPYTNFFCIVRHTQIYRTTQSKWCDKFVAFQKNITFDLLYDRISIQKELPPHDPHTPGRRYAHQDSQSILVC